MEDLRIEAARAKIMEFAKNVAECKNDNNIDGALAWCDSLIGALEIYAILTGDGRSAYDIYDDFRSVWNVVEEK